VGCVGGCGWGVVFVFVSSFFALLFFSIVRPALVSELPSLSAGRRGGPFPSSCPHLVSLPGDDRHAPRRRPWCPSRPLGWGGGAETWAGRPSARTRPLCLRRRSTGASRIHRHGSGRLRPFSRGARRRRVRRPRASAVWIPGREKCSGIGGGAARASSVVTPAIAPFGRCSERIARVSTIRGSCACLVALRTLARLVCRHAAHDALSPLPPQFVTWWCDRSVPPGSPRILARPPRAAPLPQVIRAG